MISNRASYDALLKNLTVDTPKAVYIPELKQYAECVFTADTLYIADHSSGEKMWHPVNRQTLKQELISTPDSQKMHGNMYTDPSYHMSAGNQTPPPPYTAGAYWPIQKQDLPEQEIRATAIIKSPPEIPLGMDAQQPAQKSHQENPQDLARGSATAGLKATKSRRANSQKPRRVDPKTGASVPANTPNAIAQTTYDGHRFVNSITGVQVAEGTPGAILRHRFYNRKQLDPVTGKAAAPGATDAVSISTFKRRRLVDRLTGQPAEKGAPGAITLAAWQHLRPVHPLTGESVAADFPGAISKNSYKKRKAKGKIPP
jgi:hypothetical protein